ncbi:MAG: curli production assembly protein CsgG [Oceanospirillales bacterium]|nr:curli production assembly protein CsgG [Oceanospirillales bacterium]MBR9889133.1 curli production assembly protein CsgG [Oceanospirillales bacterium]
MCCMVFKDKGLATKSAVVFCTALIVSGCATESHRGIEPQKVETYRVSYQGPRTALVVGNFDNRSNYLQGMFSSDNNRLGNQAQTILKTHLQQTNRFNVVDRQSMADLKQEAGLSGVKQQIQGARYVVTGDVTEFGRKVTGDKQLFGILGKGKTQTAYAKVSLNIVDVVTSQIVYSTQGAGEYELSNREIVGFGGAAGYDATLNSKVLNFAIMEAVNNLITDMQNGIWKIEQ